MSEGLSNYLTKFHWYDAQKEKSLAERIFFLTFAATLVALLVEHFMVPDRGGGEAKPFKSNKTSLEMMKS